MSNVPEAGQAGQGHHVGRGEEAEERGPRGPTLADRLRSAGFDEVQVDTNEYGVRFRASRAAEGV